jgi:hypothetical protein
LDGVGEVLLRAVRADPGNQLGHDIFVLPGDEVERVRRGRIERSEIARDPADHAFNFGLLLFGQDLAEFSAAYPADTLGHEASLSIRGMDGARTKAGGQCPGHEAITEHRHREGSSHLGSEPLRIEWTDAM